MLGLKLQNSPQYHQVRNMQLLQMGLYASWGDSLDTGRVDRYCTLKRNSAHIVLGSECHRPDMAARVTPQPPWHRATPRATALPWPVVPSTQPGQLG